MDAFIEHKDFQDWSSFATVFYLTLPSKVTKSQYPTDLTPGLVRDIQCSVIDPASFTLADKHKKWLCKAMEVLSLDVSVHDTQFQDNIASFSPTTGKNSFELPMRTPKWHKEETAEMKEARLKRKISIVMTF